jgi:ABC-type ATPase involved in cell division
MLKYCLLMNQVILPDPLGLWPAPLELTLELKEILLIEKVGADESASLLEVASALRPPVVGQVWHWGSDAFSLAREDRYYLLRRVAYIAPGQVLLKHLTLGENISLSPCYYQGISSRAALEENADLLEQLDLRPYLNLMTQEVEKDVYIRALMARELIRHPDLILVALDKSWENILAPSQALLFLQNYLATQGSAALLVGQSLQSFHRVASRLLRLESGRLIPYPLAEHQGRPLTDYLPLVMGKE